VDRLEANPLQRDAGRAAVAIAGAASSRALTQEIKRVSRETTAKGCGDSLAGKASQRFCVAAITRARLMRRRRRGRRRGRSLNFTLKNSQPVSGRPRYRGMLIK